MIAHDKTLLENTFFLEGAKSLKQAGFVTPEQLAKAKTATPVLKTHNNILVRIGFFLLGCLLYSSIVGVLSLFGLSLAESGYKVMVYFFAAIGLAGSELLARQNYYGYGLDDAFVLGFLAMVCTAIGISTESVTAVFVAMAVFGLSCCIRYVHALSALVCAVGIVGFFCCLVFDLEIIDALYLPFIGLVIAIAMYAFYHSIHKKPEAYFYQSSLQIVQVFSLVLGYASVNYFVVRELSVELMGIVVDAQHDIPFAAIFYLLTFAIPVFYLVYALKAKSREMLIVGILALACSVLTIWHYYSVVPVEVALLLGGIVLFGISYGCIRKLKHKESGITFERDRFSDKNALLYAQAVIVNSQVNVKPASIDHGDMPFGGGGFSGGGSSETY